MFRSLKKTSALIATLFSLSFLASCSSSATPSLKGASISEDAKFGSANILVSQGEFEKLGFQLGDSCDIAFSNGYSLQDVPYYNGYYVKNGDPVLVAYPGNEYVQITLNNTGIWFPACLEEGFTVEVTLREAKKYLTTQEALGQDYSVDRSSYSSDEEFCNFRALKGGNLKENLIYRGASPVDNKRGRASFVDSLTERKGIKAIVDLADSEENMQSYLSSVSFSSPYAESLYDEGDVALLSMGSGYGGEAYQKKVVEGFRHMLKHQAPYYVHCLEGKDRTGFVCTLIEALAGASYQEMKEDYMVTYRNYYKVTLEETPEKYEAIASLYFDSFCEYLHGTSDIVSLRTASYVEDAKEYLRMGGMNLDEIQSFISLVC